MLAGADPRAATVTRLLADIRQGDRAAFDELVPLVYEELRSLARRQRSGWSGNHTLDTTALVHEAYVKLAGGDLQSIASRAHFVGVAARAMRQILCNYARDQRRQKRGGGAARISLDDLQQPLGSVTFDDEAAERLSALEDALVRLEQAHERQARVVECRIFGGLSIEETATALGASPATVKRDLALARAWLYRELAMHASDARQDAPSEETSKHD